ncbi:MAG: hypothetical protein IPK55_12085 [Streptococcus sp.]|nr:hypothetical protein [Streptococcus sp.]
MYCQIIKQINQNSNEVSRVRNWKVYLDASKCSLQ